MSWEQAVLWLVAQPARQDEVRANYFDQPALAAAERYWRSDEWSAVRRFLPTRPALAVEIGAGNGIASFALAREGWCVLAVEPDTSAIVGTGAVRRLASEARIRVEVREGVGEALPVEDACCDLVFARQVLHHSQDLSKVCREAWRVLKRGGCFLAIREHVLSSPRHLQRFLDAHPLHHLYGRENAFTLRTYRGAFRAAGFQIETEIGPLESVINYAPLDHVSLKEEFRRRLRAIPLGALACHAFLSSRAYPLFLRLARVVDRRPGRLYSFLCTKQGGE